MELFGAILKPLGMTGVWILVLHPVPLTILVALLLLWLLKSTGLWGKHKRIILLGAGVLYAIDAAFALPRVVYAWRSPDRPVIHQKAELPARLVLINTDCEKECHARLLSGEIEEVILVGTDRLRPGVDTRTPRRYRAGWSRPGTCPQERQRAIGYDARELVRNGFCPVIEPAEIPVEGIFVVKENFLVTAKQKAVRFTPSYLVDGPPGKTIGLMANEVQHRTRGGVKVLAARRSYRAPGLLGLPPLVGCWERPDNIIWIMPPGDTGCGLWRWFTGGGDFRWNGDVAWVYGDVFVPPARSVRPPSRPDIPPVDPAEAIEVLSRVSPIEDYLPALQEALVAPSVSDDALVDLVVRRTRRGTLDGALVAVLAQKRPQAAAAIPAQLGQPPKSIGQPGLILAEMERDRAIFDAWGDFMFDAMASLWPKVIAAQGRVIDPAIERFLALLHDRDSDFLCQRLDRITREGGVLDYRDKVASKDYFEALPLFLPLVIRAAVAQCGERAREFLRALLQAPAAVRRSEIAWLISRMVGDIAGGLADQAFANLLDDRGMDYWVYKDIDRRRAYVDAHLQILFRAGQSCDDVERKLDAAIAELRQRGGAPSQYLLERLAYLGRNEPGRPMKCELR